MEDIAQSSWKVTEDVLFLWMNDDCRQLLLCAGHLMCCFQFPTIEAKPVIRVSMQQVSEYVYVSFYAELGEMADRFSFWTVHLLIQVKQCLPIHV